MTEYGASCMADGYTVRLDPRRTDANAINFVSHAHMDHLPSRGGGSRGVVLASFETGRIAAGRGVALGDHAETWGQLRLTYNGHILGARGLLMDDVFYTGDICTREREFLPACSVPRCRILVTECTFGLPEFAFPSIRDVKSRVNGIISDLYSRGIPVILMGYQLGKAQILTSMFGHWDPLILHDSVKEMNDLHRSLGVNLRDAPGHTEAEAKQVLQRRPWVMIAPTMSKKNPFVRRMKEKYGAVTIGFSGWAGSARFASRLGCDYSIPLSDHCDFEDLVRLVRESGAEKVYAVHGFVEEFSSQMNLLGFDAEPLR